MINKFKNKKLNLHNFYRSAYCLLIIAMEVCSMVVEEVVEVEEEVWLCIPLYLKKIEIFFLAKRAFIILKIYVLMNFISEKFMSSCLSIETILGDAFLEGERRAHASHCDRHKATSSVEASAARAVSHARKCHLY